MFLINLKNVFKHYSHRNFSSFAKSRQDMILIFTNLGLSEQEASTYITKHRLKQLNNDHLKQVLSFCESVGYSNDEIIKYPQIFKIRPMVLDHHYLTLKEGGFKPLTVKILMSFRTLVHKTVKLLKTHKCIPEHVNVAKSFTSYLKPMPIDFDVSDITDDQVFTNVHRTILRRYLMWKLEATQDEIERLFRLHTTVTNKSFQNICLNIAIAEELGINSKRLLKCGYLLHNYPKYPLTMLTEMPEFAGVDIATAMRKYPKLIMVAPQNYIDIHQILQEANIPDQMIKKTPNIFLLSPTTLKIRLDEINRIPETRVLLNNPRILQLLVHHNRARSRLSFLQHIKLRCASCGILVDNGDSFQTHIQRGQDENLFHELRGFLMSLLKVDSDLIETNIKKHPFHLQVPLVQIEKTYNFLRHLRFRNQAIINVLQILLYPADKIEAALENIRKDIKNPAQYLNQSQKLNMALYLIEKEHHFNGNGIWNKTEDPV